MPCMKKIELNREKLQFKKQKIAPLTRASNHEEPTTTVLLSIMHKCPPLPNVKK